MPALRFDLFCRVIDNHGDLGVCWRLARRLVALGASVRLWIDAADGLRWMAPHGAPGVELRPWADPAAGDIPGQVVIEAFGCDPPPAFVAAMATQPSPPLWINLEYLSAEDYVERSHALPSPQLGGPGRGLMKWFFYPGFTPATGGLLLEEELVAERDAHDGVAWLAARGFDSPAAHRISLFCYEQPALPAWLDRWSAAGGTTALYLTPGHATQQAAQWLGRPLEAGQRARRGGLALIALPWLSQPDYDRLLWSCDLNLVRGEDSLVRALWAGRPLLWQAYRQSDGAHRDKIDAFLARHLGGIAPAAMSAWQHWNGAPAAAPDGLLDTGYRLECAAAAAALLAQQQAHGDLGTRLYAFIGAKR